MTTRDEMVTLFLDNTVLIHNLLVADARSMREDAEETTDKPTAAALRDYAKFREDLAEQIATYLRRRDAEVIAEDVSGAELKAMMKDPRYWRDQDPAIVEKVREGFRRLYHD